MKISRERITAFITMHKSDKKTLNVGAKKGSYKDLFPNQLSIDISPESKPDIVADVHDLPFKDNEFEIILCTEVLEHVIDPKQAILEMYRVLNSGGKLILTTRFLYPIHEAPNDYWRFTRYNLEYLFENWKEVKVIEEADSVTSLASLLQRFSWQSTFVGNYFWKIFFAIIVRIMLCLPWIVKKQYGDIGKKTEVPIAFTTGYCVVALK